MCRAQRNGRTPRESGRETEGERESYMDRPNGTERENGRKKVYELINRPAHRWQFNGKPMRHFFFDFLSAPLILPHSLSVSLSPVSAYIDHHGVYALLFVFRKSGN